MTVSLKHLVTATGTDAGNGQIGKAQWNDEHTLTLASQKLLGRASAGAGAVEEIDLTAAGRALLDDPDATAQRATLGLGSMSQQDANTVAITGGTISNATITGGTITGITDLAVADGGTGASDAAGARSNLGLGSLATLSSVDTAQITNSAVTYAKMQNVSATDRFLGRSSAGAGVVEEIVCTAAGRAILDDATAAAQLTTLGLSTSSGSNEIGFIQSGTGAVARTVQGKLRDVISVLDFMSDAKRADVLDRTGLYDHSAEIVAAATASVAQGKALYCPGGQYNFGAPGQLRATALTVTVPAGKSFYIYGDGPGDTVFKEAAGQNAVIGRFDYMWYITTAIGDTASSVTFRDITIDKNGASNGAPPTPYAWEQSHCIAITPGYTSAASSGAINAVFIENVETLDKVGAGINLGGGAIYAATLINCHGRNFSGLFGERGDLEFQASVGELLIMNCTGTYVQSEPNVSSPFLNVRPKATFISCQYTVFDLVGYSSDQDLQQYALVNCETPEGGEFWIREGVLTVTGGRLGVSSRVDWRNATSRISDCTIIVKHDAATNTFSYLYISAVGIVKQDHVFTNCTFTAESTASGTTTGYAFFTSTVPTGSNYMVEFNNCMFDPIFQNTADCYRGGAVLFANCSLTSRVGGQAIRTGGDATYPGIVTLANCDLTNVSGALVNIAGAGASAWYVRFDGQMDYAKFSLTGRPATEYQDTKVIHNCIWMSDSRPAAAGLNGQIVRIRKPTVGTANEYVCFTGNITTATWRMGQQAGLARDTTANRPVPNANDIGLMYLDTTLDADGKPIWWNGTAWIDATGLVV